MLKQLASPTQAEEQLVQWEAKQVEKADVYNTEMLNVCVCVFFCGCVYKV